MLVAFAFFFSQADGVSSNSDLSLWLKAEGYSVESINTITMVSPSVTFVASIVCGVLSDVYNTKASLIAIAALLNIFACIVWRFGMCLLASSSLLSSSPERRMALPLLSVHGRMRFVRIAPRSVRSLLVR